MGKSRRTGKRISGASASVFGFGAGVSTTPVSTDRDICQALVTFLEDRRVLFNPEYLEVPSQVDHSVIEIRKQLTKALQQIDPKSAATESIRTMRAACRRYLDDPRQSFRHFDGYLDRFHVHGWHERNAPGFFLALGELRATFGVELMRLDNLYSLDIELQLRAVFPKEDESPKKKG